MSPAGIVESGREKRACETCGYERFVKVTYRFGHPYWTSHCSACHAWSRYNHYQDLAEKWRAKRSRILEQRRFAELKAGAIAEARRMAAAQREKKKKKKEE